MLTCKELLQGLNDYLDDTADPDVRASIERHISQCPNCWVIVDTTRKTLRVYKGMEPQQLPPDVEFRLLSALSRKFANATGSTV